MKISFSKKILIFFGIFAIGAGMGVGSMMLKEHFFPSEGTKVVYVEKKPDEIGPLIEMEEFVVNLAGGGILKTELTIEGINTKSEEKIKSKEIFLRDRILKVLGTKRFDDVSSTEGRESLKVELVSELNEICKDEVKDVLFKGFIYSL